MWEDYHKNSALKLSYLMFHVFINAIITLCNEKIHQLLLSEALSQWEHFVNEILYKYIFTLNN